MLTKIKHHKQTLVTTSNFHQQTLLHRFSTEIVVGSKSNKIRTSLVHTMWHLRACNKPEQRKTVQLANK